MGRVRVFVYGSLKKTQCNNIVLRGTGATFLRYASVTGPYQLLDMGPYPAMTPVEDAEENTTIFGEIWVGGVETLRALDHLEGYYGKNEANFYTRVKMKDDKGTRIWTYVLTEDWEVEAKDVNEHGIWNPTNDEYDHWGGPRLGLDGPPHGGEEDSGTDKEEKGEANG